jgi:uncharacterized repeat protein (TIGR03803 family)
MPQVSTLRARPNSTNYKVVYSFGAVPDGNYPDASLVDVNGTLYGTTAYGGAYSCLGSYNGCGTVFSITPSGTEKVLYSFGAPPDGETPLASVIDVDGTLYGTTSAGGSYTCPYDYYEICGTVFSITPGGTEKVLHGFRGADGLVPFAGLIDVDGTLYGTTTQGGHGCYTFYDSCGTVFSITTAGTEKVLHSFNGGRADGSQPFAGLIEVNGTLYGTTSGGGKYKCRAKIYQLDYCGTVFSITTGGAVKVLYSFKGGSDGANPRAPLIALKGKLYGTTAAGGGYHGSGCYPIPEGCGTVFSITPNGKEKVLHIFGAEGDGQNPDAGLIELEGKLYGTTTGGGAYDCGGKTSRDCGTVFSITPGGKEKVLHSFGDGTDGVDPRAGLIDVKGTLYGTTQYGGANGDGTVFALTP